MKNGREERRRSQKRKYVGVLKPVSSSQRLKAGKTPGQSTSPFIHTYSRNNLVGIISVSLSLGFVLHTLKSFWRLGDSMQTTVHTEIMKPTTFLQCECLCVRTRARLCCI